MRDMVKIFILFIAILSLWGNWAKADVSYTSYEFWLTDTPTKYGFRGLYTLFSPETYRKGKFGVGFYWDMARFCLPGDPRYPELQEFTLAGAYGITDLLEIGVAAPFRSLTIPAASSENRDLGNIALRKVSESGFSNLSIGVRYKVLDWMTPYVQAFLPTASVSDKGSGAENTRIHLGVSLGHELEGLNDTRLYGQMAYQFATNYAQERRDFSETDPNYPRPRFERFGTNPLFHEYGNTLFYGAGFALPILENTFELFSEFQFYHSFEEKGHIPLFEDGKPLDLVQDGGLANVGVKVGFNNGLSLTAGWSGVLFAEEPMYESPTWKTFAGLTYHRPRKGFIDNDLFHWLPYEEVPPTKLNEPDEPIEFYDYHYGPDCMQAMVMVHFEFDKSTLTPESIAALQRIGKYLRMCSNVILEIQGHTDWKGTENYNIGLANRRARAAVYYLVYDEGIDLRRIVAPEKLAKGLLIGESYGESVPIASNDTEKGRVLNRRVQFIKLAQRNNEILRKRLDIPE